MQEPITAAEVRRKLPTSKHHLDDELERQADTLERISAEVVRANTRSIQAKDELARIEASVLEDIMFEATREGIKVTVDQAQGRVRRSTERNKAWQRWSDARAAHEEWQGLHEAWRTKGFNIKAMAELYASQYFSTTMTSVQPRDRRRDDIDHNARARLRDASTASVPRERRSLT